MTLANFIRGLEQAGANHAGLLARLGDFDRLLSGAPDPISIDETFNELLDIIDKGIGGAYFLDTGREILGNLDRLAVSFITEDALQAWRGFDPTATFWSVHETLAECLSLQVWVDLAKGRKTGTPLPAWKGADLAAATAGRAGRALWLAPQLDAVSQLLEKGRSYAVLGLDADDGDYCELANGVANLLGFAQHPSGSCIIAAISRRPIGEIAADATLMGPSVLEGGTNRRWRHWSEDYGRTYHLESTINESGVPEAVCRPLSLDEIGEFIFMGCVNRDYRESDQTFAAVIGVSHAVPALLGQLHALTGI